MTKLNSDLAKAIEIDRAEREPKSRTALNPKGRERPDPTPMQPPIGYKKQPSMVELVRQAVRDEHLRRDLNAAGMETFEESEDFDIPDDPVDPTSRWENDYDPPAAEIRREVETAKAKKAADEAATQPKTKEPSGSPSAPATTPNPDPKTPAGGAS